MVVVRARNILVARVAQV